MPIEIEISILLFVVAVLGVLGYMVFFRNKYDVFLRSVFLAQSILGIGWAVSSLARIVDTSIAVSTISAEVVYFSSTGVLAVWVVVGIALSKYEKLRIPSAIVCSILWLLLCIAIFLPRAFIESVAEPPDRTIYFGPSVWLFYIYSTVMSIAAIGVFIMNIATSRTQLERVRQTVIGMVVIVCLSIVGVVGIIMPAFGNFSVYWLAPIVLLLLSSGIVLSMFRYRLLNFSTVSTDTINENLVIDISRLLIKNESIKSGLKQTVDTLNSILEIRASAIEVYDNVGQLHVGEEKLTLGRELVTKYIDESGSVDDYSVVSLTLDDAEFTDPIYKYFLTHHIGYAALFGNSKKGIYGSINIRITNNKIWGTKQTSLLTTIGNVILLSYENSKARMENEELRRIDTAKDEVLNIASHNLRTPLTVVRGYIELSLSGKVAPLPPALSIFLHKAEDETHKMGRIINDFLTLSRIQMGRFQLQLETIDLKDVVSSEVEDMNSIAANKKMTIGLIVQPGEYYVSIDESKIRQVITNLIDNAMYYSGDSRVITVRLAQDIKNIIFTVEDHGIGVPEESRDKLWQKFSRADNAKTYRPDGTGTGLYMIKRIVEDHKGGVIYEPLEHGSKFGFTLPRQKGLAPPKPAAQPAASTASPAPAATPAPPAQPHVVAPAVPLTPVTTTDPTKQV